MNVIYFLLTLSISGILQFSPEFNFNDSNNDFGIFSMQNASTVIMNGEIDENTLDDFDAMIERYPNINKIILIEVPGSSDDDVNLEVSVKVHEKNIATHLADNGLIASGGVDFFLAGTRRTMGSNTRIGVHSWTDDDHEATDYPVGHEEHLSYIKYYQRIGFSAQEAEAFYYFTINAADSDHMHFMSLEEIEHFKILKP